jgi:UDP-N-acetylglucosamine 2-epimerase (non-hydrolysing)
MKIMTIIGTRPELIKMSRVISCLDENFDHILVHSGQNYDYELNQIFFDELQIRKPDFFLDVTGVSASKVIADVISKAEDVFLSERPDAVLFYGDTNTCLAVIAAKKQKIPVFHMEAGNRCFDQRVPEELNRKILDHLSDINLVLTEHARNNLIAEGVAPQTIIKTGSHMQEVLEYYMPKILESKILQHLGLEKGRYFIASAHREETVDNQEKLRELIQSFNDLAENYKYPIVVSTHPRTRNRLNKLADLKIHPLINFIKPFGFLDYIKLQMNAFCVLSDSGSLTEEASLLNLPAIALRDVHERPEGMDDGVLVMSGLKSIEVLESVKLVTKYHRDENRNALLVSDYNVGKVSEKISKILLTYIGYVNRNIWFKT